MFVVKVIEGMVGSILAKRGVSKEVDAMIPRKLTEVEVMMNLLRGGGG